MSPPRDAPLLMPGAAVTIPPVPSTFKVEDLGWMTLAYPPSVAERVKPLIETAPAFKASLTDELGQPVLDHVEVRIARNPDEMVALAPRELPPFSYAEGIAYRSIHLVILSLTAPQGGEATELVSVFKHELFHVALEDAVLGQHVPLWFNEGMAIYVSDEHRLDRIGALWHATLSHTLLPFSELDRAFPSQNYEVSVAYAESSDFVRYLLRDQDQLRFLALIERVRKGQSFDHALADAYDTDLRKLEFRWREDISKRYTFAPLLAGGTFVWTFGFVALLVAYVRKRRKDRATLARWEAEEALQVARSTEPSFETPDLAAHLQSPGLPKVEHEGNWHTLH